MLKICLRKERLRRWVSRKSYWCRTVQDTVLICIKPRLAKLLVELDKIEKLKLVRVMYLYPDEITAELIDVMKKCEKVAKYVDLPLQHISDKILKAMNRRGSSTDIRTIIREFREAIPEVVIRTSLIVGFQGDRKTLMSFVIL